MRAEQDKKTTCHAFACGTYRSPLAASLASCAARVYYSNMAQNLKPKTTITRKLCEQLAGTYTQVKHQNACYYCDGPAETQDHFVPVSIAAFIKFDDKQKILIPACRRCNSTAGNKVFPTVSHKRSWIRSRREQWKLEDEQNKLTAYNAERRSKRSAIGKGSARKNVGKLSMLMAIATQGTSGNPKWLGLLQYMVRVIREWPPSKQQSFHRLLQTEWLAAPETTTPQQIIQQVLLEMRLGIRDFNSGKKLKDKPNAPATKILDQRLL